jgi:ubiquinol-cytochrome c reductase cytochrome c1 subunit
MKTFKLIAAAALVSGFLGGVAQAQHAHEQPTPPRIDWSFAGPFGKFDKTQLQRGFKVYKEVCANCHSINLLAFRNLAEPGGPGFSQGQVKALAATFKVKDGPNDAGDMFEREGRPADRWPSPFPNKQAAAAANGGAIPPDFSVIAKARTYARGFPWFLVDMFTQYQEHGVDYITALLTGYSDDTHGMEIPAGKYYNTYFPGNVIAMPKPLNDGQVEYVKGADGRPQAPETVEQYSKDVSAFLMWAAEPHLEKRKETGFKAIAYLIVLAGLLYFTKKKIWARIEDHHSHA